ncbi:MAG TPA: hypothetical protein VFQ53_37325 [Kofleriaceae bacterium]|nr:hypothetical protein [Kofleriaceae bacterium]
MSRTARIAAAVTVLMIASAAPAHAYEFWLRSQTIGQAYQLREYRLVGPDLFLGRRRYAQTLALRIWDIGDLSRDRRIARLPDRGLRISWQSYLRIDHDFGSYASGRIAFSNTDRRDALDVIPELEESLIDLDLLYGYLELAGIADDRVTVRVGRVLDDQGWGTTAFDGGSVRVELPPPLAVTASAGLRVRARSPMGLSAYELDGTAGAACREYVEGTTPGTGHWKLIDRNRTITNTRFSSDFEYCPERDQLQPTVGLAIATSRVRGFGAELGYRRTWSSTVGLIGTPDRLLGPDIGTDVGLYPNEFGQAPGSGVDEERLYARVHADLERDDVHVQPFANARFSLLHAAIDRMDAGVRLGRGSHTLEPAVEYFLPTFDGDSIFNAFSIEPTFDTRVGYRFDGPIRAYANAWLRRYSHEDGLSSWSGGLDAGAEQQLTTRLRARGDALWDDGYGGRRVGGSGELAARARQTLWLRGRVIVLGVAEDDRPHYITSSTVVSSTWKLADSVALHSIIEADYDEIHDLQTRVIAVLDLAFAPEP